MLEHEWLTSEVPHFVENETGEPRDLLPHVRKAFDAKRTCASHFPLPLVKVLSNVTCSPKSRAGYDGDEAHDIARPSSVTRGAEAER